MALLFAAVPTAASAAGPFTITPSVAIRYDTNVARASDELAADRGIKKADTRITPNLNIDFEKPLGRQVFYLNGDVGYNFYARNHGLNRGRILLNSGLRLRFSRCSGSLNGSFALQQTDPAELIDTSRAKNTEHISTIGVEAKCGGATGLGLFAGASRTWQTNSASDRRYADFNMNQAHGGISYARPVLGELALAVAVKDADYPHRDALFGSDRFHTFSIGGRYTREVGSRLQGTVALNRTTVDTGSGGPKFTGLTSDVSLTALISDNLKTQVRWVRDVQPVSVGFGSFNIDSRLSVDANYGLSPRLTLNAGGGLIHRHIEGENPLFGPQLDHERRTYEYVGVSYKRSARTSLDLDVRHEQRTADPSLFNYSSTSVGLALRTRF